MNKRITLSFLIILLYFYVAGQIPPGYYDPAAGKTGVQLQTALHNIIKGHTTVSYNSLYDHFQSTDKKSNGTVWDMYSDIPGGTPPYVYHYNSNEECGNYNGEGDCFNREHSWPNSWFGGEVMPMYSDMFHLYPTDGYVNNRRSNFPYGEVGQVVWISENGSKLGSSVTPGYNGSVFEPIDEYKGDFARTYFYMSVRYYTEDNGWPGSEMTNGSQLKPWAQAMMLLWNDQDPVSQKEVNRNNAIYQIQDNRNPFIDHPEYADAIWGTNTGVRNNENPTRLIIFPNPAVESCTMMLPDDRTFDLVVYDLAGKSVDIPYEKTGNKIKMNIIGLLQGSYVVRLQYPGDASSVYGLMLKN